MSEILDAPTKDTRLRWQQHILAAINDLRNSDRSEFEQKVYDALRVIVDAHLEEFST